MKPLIVNFRDIEGGASRAAYRIHRALLLAGVESRMLVRQKDSDDWTVDCVNEKRNKLVEIRELVRPMLGNLANRLLKTQNRNFHSAAILASALPRRINGSGADVVHLHWIGKETMSIEDVARIRKPVVWTLHDMWPFCGTEHYTTDMRWREGYRRDNRPGGEGRLDLNRWAWNRKRKAWKHPMVMVSPSKWLAGCVRESALMRSWPVVTIPNAVDTDVWRPMDKREARKLLNLPPDARLLMFGAIGGGRDPRKGMDLLLAALDRLRGRIEGLELVVVGQSEPGKQPDLGFRVHWMGHLHDDLSLRVLNCAADALLIPSRQDNLPNTGVEALACGRPVIAFDIGGLPDIVMHQDTGWLAKPLDPDDLARGIQWTLADPVRHAGLCENARTRAIAKFSYGIVASRYKALYEHAAEVASTQGMTFDERYCGTGF